MKNIKLNQRIYINISKELLQNNNLYYYISYLKLQQTVLKTGGKFKFKHLVSVLNISEKACYRHLKKLIGLNLISKLDDDYYQFNSQAKLDKDKGVYKTQYYIKITINEILSLTYKTLSSFKAKLMVMLDAKFEKSKNSLIKGFTVTNLKDKNKTKIKDGSLRRFHGFIAGCISAFYCNKSEATISRWRRKQSNAKYSNYVEEIKDVSLLNIPTSELNNTSEFGKYFKYKGKLFFSSISEIEWIKPIRFYRCK